MSNLKQLNLNDFKMKIIKDLGMEYPTSTSKQKTRYIVFECPVCRKHFKRSTQVAKKTTMCNSCRRSRENNPNYKHGEQTKGFKSKNYSRWANMMTRCYNTKSKDYKNYGGRGIKVSNEFKNFKNYNDCINSLPDANKKGCTIDRINVNSNYERTNLRWADITTQAFNKNLSSKSTTGAKGVTKTRWGTYLARVTVAKRTRKELGNFKTIEEAKRAIEVYYKNNKRVY